MRTKMFSSILLFVTAIAFSSATGKAAGFPDVAKVKMEASPFQQCQGVSLINHADYAKNREFWDAVNGQCGGKLQVMPEDGLLAAFGSIVGKIWDEQEAQKTEKFLDKVGERTLKYIELNDRVNDVMLNCAKNDASSTAWFTKNAAAANTELANAKTDREREMAAAKLSIYDPSKCDELITQLSSSIQNVAQAMRKPLALSAYNLADPPPSMMGMGTTLHIPNGGQTERYINSYLMVPYGMVGAGMKALSDAEIKEYSALYEADTKQYVEEYREKYKNEPLRPGEEDWRKDPNKIWGRRGLQQYLDNRHQEKFNEYRAQYNDLMQKAPILAYLNNTDPKSPTYKKDLTAALTKLKANSSAQRKELQETISGAKKTIFGGDQVSPEYRAKAMLDLMKFGPVVQEILAENQENCGVASSLVKYISNTELRNNIGLMTMMIGGVGAAALRGTVWLASAGIASSMSGATLAFIAATPFSLYSYSKDFQRYWDAEKRFANYAVAMEDKESGVRIGAVGDLGTLMSAESALTMSIALAALGVDFWGSGLGKYIPFLGKGLTAEAATARAAAEAMLLKKGFSSGEAADLLKALESKNVALAKSEAIKAIGKLGLDDAEIKILQAASKQNVLAGVSAKLVMEELAGMSKDDLKKIANDAIAIFQELNPAKINEGNRLEIMRAALAGAKFGVKDPKKLAAIMTEWSTGGLHGLSLVYRRAALIMEKEGVESEKAFSMALDDLLKERPDMQLLAKENPSKFAEMRDQMLNCGCGCKK